MRRYQAILVTIIVLNMLTVLYSTIYFEGRKKIKSIKIWLFEVQ